MMQITQVADERFDWFASGKRVRADPDFPSMGREGAKPLERTKTLERMTGVIPAARRRRDLEGEEP
jgi:hypothetical protein